MMHDNFIFYIKSNTNGMIFIGDIHCSFNNCLKGSNPHSLNQLQYKWAIKLYRENYGILFSRWQKKTLLFLRMTS